MDTFLGFTPGHTISVCEFRAIEAELKRVQPTAIALPLNIVFKTVAATTPVLFEGKTVIHECLVWTAVSFIQARVRESGSLESASKLYDSFAPVCVYGRNFARNIFGTAEGQEAYAPIQDWYKKRADKAAKPVLKEPRKKATEPKAKRKNAEPAAAVV